MHERDEIDLVRRAIAGNRDALAQLWMQTRRFVAAVLVAAGAREPGLQDAVQDTAYALTRGIGSLRDPAAFRPWLRSLALNALRSARRRPALDPLADEPAAPARDSGAADEVAQLQRALADLPADYREALVLRAVDGLSQAAIAQTLGVPETTVESRLARARRLLRGLLSRGAPAADPTSPLPVAARHRGP